MTTNEYKEKVLEHYDTKISENYDGYPCLTEISTEDGYNFYAIQYDSSGTMDYYYSEDAMYEEVINLIRDGVGIYGIDSDNIEWEELYSEVAEQELDDKIIEIKAEVEALIKPVARNFLEQKIFTKEVAKLICPEENDDEFVAEQQNDYILLLLKDLKFV